ncbi:MAG: murD [Frankiales bacterium]|nr:murD [Frankiales bacterium]
MPSPISWAELRGRRVALWGLGVEGRANLRRTQVLGLEPLLVDDSTEEVDGRPVARFDEALPQLLGCEVVVKSPGISRYGEQCRQLTAAGVEVVGGLGLWLAGADRSRVACITGTKGKSTTTSIAGGLLGGLAQRYHLGGNLGSAPWDPEVGDDFDWWVVETSSYQALDVVVGPKVVAVTSLSEDHLPWHNGSAETYFQDKLSLCTRPGVTTVIADAGDPLLQSHRKLLGEHVHWVERGASEWSQNGALLGEHNRRNAEIAREVLVALGVPGADDEQALAAAFAAFTPLPHRLTPVAEGDGVLFVDDSISTNALSALAAVDSFPGRRVALLVGGLDRDIDYRPLADGLAGRADLLVVTMPTNGPTIGGLLAGRVAVQQCSSLEEATRAGHAWAKQGGGVVVLSPAAASFDLFADYQARGEAFAQAARQLV